MMGDDDYPCTNCNDEWWVCENHLTTPWGGGDGCCGGAGAPCPVCCPERTYADPIAPNNSHALSGVEMIHCPFCGGKAELTGHDPRASERWVTCRICGACSGKAPTAPQAVSRWSARVFPPKHQYWGAGEPGCPWDIKASNGELYMLRCKVCGNEDARDTICHAKTTS
jgi:hypothetical protein